MHNILIILLIIITSTYSSKAGLYNDIDSLNHEAAKLKIEDRPELLLAISDKYFNINFDSSYFFAKEAYRISVNKKNTIGIIRASEQLGRIGYFSNNLEEYKYYYKIIEDLLKTVHKNNLRGKIYHTMGILRSFEEDYDRSLDYFFKALELFDSGNYQDIAEIYMNIASLLYVWNEVDNSEQFYYKALENFEKVDDKYKIGLCYLKFGVIKRNSGDIDSAKYYLNRAYNIAKSSNNIALKTNIDFYVASVHEKKGEYEKALAKIKEAVDQNIEINNYSIAATYINLAAHINILLENYNKSIEINLYALSLRKKVGDISRVASSYTNLARAYIYNGEYDKAEKYQDSAYKILITLNNPWHLINNLKNYVFLYEKLGDLEKGIYYQKKIVEYQEQSFREEKSKQLLINQLLQENLQNLSENELLKERNRLQEITIGISILAFILAVFVLTWMYRLKNKMNVKLEKSVKERTLELDQKNVLLTDEIEKRINSEKLIKDSEQKFRSLFNSAGDSILIMKDDIFIDCNDKTLEIFGCTREQIINKPPYVFSPNIQPDGKKSKDKALEKIQSAFKGVSEVFYWKHMKFDGTLFDAEVSLSSFILNDEPYLQAIVRDTSEKQKFIDTIKENEERFRMLVEHSPTGIFLVDLSGRVIDVNPKMLDILSLTYDNAKEINVFEFEPFKTGGFAASLKTCVNNAEEVRGEGYYKSELVSKAYLRYNINPLTDSEGRIYAALANVEDFTDRKLYEEALLISEQKYRDFIENANDAIFVAQGGKLQYFNPQVRELLGYSENDDLSEIVSLPFIEFIHKSDREMVYQRHVDRLSGKEVPREYSFRLVDRTGKERWVEINSVVINWEGNAATLNFLSDITEKKIIQDMIKAQRDIVLELISSSDFQVSINNCLKYMTDYSGMDSSGLYITDENGDFILRAHQNLSPHFLEDSSYIRKDSPLIKNLLKSNPIFIDIEELNPYFSDQQKNEGLKNAAIYPVKFNNNILGSLHLASHTTNEIPNEIKITLEIITSLIANFINRFRILEELRNSEEKARVMLNSQKDSVVLIDKNCIIVDLNKPAEIRLGKTYEELISKDLFANGQFNGISRNIVKKIVESGKPMNIEFENREIIFENTLLPIFNDAEVVTQVALFSEDVTQKRKSQENLQKIARLESIGTLAGGIAHNFKNMLASMAFNVGFAKMNAAKAPQYLDKLNSSIERASALASRFQTFTSGGEPIRDVQSILPIIEASASMALSGSNNKLLLNIPEGLWKVEIDPKQMNEALTNIIINASDAMPGGGEIIITANNTVIPKNNNLNLEPGNYLELRIKDSGSGIQNDIKSKIFDPFFSTKEDNHGLGLTTAHYIIRKHNGIIKLGQNSDTGTEIIVFIPAITQDLESSSAEELTELKKQNARILILDDEIDIRDNLEEFGELLGYNIEGAATGEEAIEKYKQSIKDGNKYSIIILDLTVRGGMGGEPALKILRSIDPDFSAIVFSGHSSKPIVANYKEYGFDGKLDKPVDILKLESILNKFI